MSISQVLSSIVHGNIDHCCFCFQEFGENAVWIDDEIFIDSQDIQTMSVLINSVFGENILNAASAFGVFCDQCKIAVVNNYKFRKMCKENLQNLSLVIESVTESCENMLPEMENYSTLFVTLDSHNFTSKQFYDEIHYENTSTAFKRFCSVKIATTKVDQKEHNPRNTLNKDKIRTDKVKLEPSAKIEGLRRYMKTRKERLVYDIPSFPTGDMVADITDLLSYKCKVCLKKYIDESKFRWHFFKQHCPRQAKCSKCPRRYITNEMLQQHEEEFHNPLVCSECGKLFASKYTLQKHELNHNLRITCEECGRVYRSMEAFRKHISDDVCRHKGKKSADQAIHQCDYCNKRYCYKPYLAKHIMYEHGNAVGYRCEYCNKQFYTQSRLNTHILKHTREKNYVCTICNGRFVTRESLLYHTRLHTGEKPYQCEHCDKAFLSASRRLDHTRRHHMAPTLECDICHGKFKATGSLLKHRKRHFNPNSRLNSMRHSYAAENASKTVEEK